MFSDPASAAFQSRFDAFGIFWLGGVSVFGIASLVWGIYELRRGQARWGWMGAKYTREEEPFYYWMAVLSRFGGFVVACFMFWFGLGMFRWQ
jgi:hypothetical protein